MESRIHKRISSTNRLALLMHDYVTSPNGKMGFGLMRYGVAPVVVVIDRANAGGNLRALTGISCDAPIVSTMEEALTYSPDILVPAIAPGGGLLPEEWKSEIRTGISNGLSLVNGLHIPMADDPYFAEMLKPNRFIWDIRQEPGGLENGLGRARELVCKRVLFVGTDMACGKMTAALELHNGSLRRGIKSKFAATGQIGIAISGDGVPLDAVRIDFATGAIEGLVMRLSTDSDCLFIEGQGSLLNPASTATLALMRGACPTHMILVHRAGQKSIDRAPWAIIPDLKRVIALNEMTCSAAGAMPAARIVGIALVTSHLDDDQAQSAISAIENYTGIVTTDVVRYGPDRLLDVLFS